MYIAIYYYSTLIVFYSTSPWFYQWRDALDTDQKRFVLNAVVLRRINRDNMEHDLNLEITESILGIRLSQERIKNDIKVYWTLPQDPHTIINYP